MCPKRDRKKNRLEDYDDSQNSYYFVTTCAKDRMEWFGKIRDEKMILNKRGEIAQRCWIDLHNHYKNCELDEFIIMPNHVHGIVIINNGAGTGLKPVPAGNDIKTHSLSEIMRGFKTFSSRRINEQNSYIIFRWQRSFYDHIIRHE